MVIPVQSNYNQIAQRSVTKKQQSETERLGEDFGTDPTHKTIKLPKVCHREIENMGNNCPNIFKTENSRMSSSNRPPRDLKTFLVETLNREAHTDHSRYHWTASFKRYLESISPQHGNLLTFVLAAERLKVEKDNQRRCDIVEELKTHFFSTDCGSRIVLQNRSLYAELEEALQNNNDNIQEVMELVEEAKCDRKVWKDGLDKAYNDFLSTKPKAMPTMAVIMSLL